MHKKEQVKLFKDSEEMNENLCKSALQSISVISVPSKTERG
jgi:hypothetical protein